METELNILSMKFMKKKMNNKPQIQKNVPHLLTRGGGICDKMNL